MKTSILFGIIALLLLAACAQEAVQSTPAKEPVVIKIGALLPLSGDAAAYGTEFQRIADIALEEINAQGGVNGNKLEIIYEDSKCNPKDGATAAQKLIDVDKVKVILGGACSGETLGAAPIAEQAKVIMLSPSASSPDITNAGDFIFRTNPSDAYAGKIAAEKTIRMGFKKVAIIHETTDYAQGLKKVFEETFRNKGGEVATIEKYGSDENDFKTQLSKIKASNPEAVYIVTQSPNKAGLILKQMKQIGLNKQVIMDAVMIRGTLKDSTDLLEGVVGVEPKFDQNGSVAKTLFDKYHAKYGNETFGFYDAATYDAVYLIAEGLGKHGDNTEAFRDFLYATKNRPGAIGDITFDKNGDLITKFSVTQVKNGKLEEIEVAQ